MNNDSYTGVQKAAILLITLGPEKAATIFKHLKEDEIEELTLEIANTRSVSPQTKEEVLEEFYQVCLAQQYIAEGGIGYAKELLEKLAEYKPLAKIEEIEEQNYNMIDDRLNNGVEKFNREEEKKEQVEKPQARTSLKERLAAKQTEVAQGKNKDAKEQDKTKKTNREEI